MVNFQILFSACALHTCSAGTAPKLATDNGDTCNGLGGDDAEIRRSHDLQDRAPNGVGLTLPQDELGTKTFYPDRLKSTSQWYQLQDASNSPWTWLYQVVINGCSHVPIRIHKAQAGDAWVSNSSYASVPLPIYPSSSQLHNSLAPCKVQDLPVVPLCTSIMKPVWQLMTDCHWLKIEEWGEIDIDRRDHDGRWDCWGGRRAWISKQLGRKLWRYQQWEFQWRRPIWGRYETEQWQRLVHVLWSCHARGQQLFNSWAGLKRRDWLRNGGQKFRRHLPKLSLSNSGSKPILHFLSAAGGSAP